MSPKAAAKEKATRLRWRKENYDRFYVDAPKGMRDALKALAQERGLSFRQMMIEILERELDN